MGGMGSSSHSLRSGGLVVLTRPRASDASEFLRRAKASASVLAPWVYPPTTALEFDAYLRRTRRRDQSSFFVRDPDGGLTGVVNLSNIVRGNFHSAYVGYYLFAGYEGRGRMTEALGLVVRYAFEAMGLHRIEANVQPGNERSLALVRRCGFRREGFSPRYLKIGGGWRDHERWAITVEDLAAG